MSRDFDNNIRKIIDSNNDLHKDADKTNKELANLKRLVQSLDIKIQLIDSKINQIYEILNTFSLMIEEEEEINNDDWTPYDDENWEIEEDDEEEDDQYYPENFSDN